MRLALYREIPEDSVLRGQWNDLVFGMERPQVFYTYEWALAVSRAYRESLTPLLWLAHEGGRLAGVAALAESKQRPKCVHFLSAATGDYCDFICAAGDAEAFSSAVLNDLKEKGFSSATFANAPADSPAVTTLLADAGSFGYHVYKRTAYHCAQIVLGDENQRQHIRSAASKRQMVRRQISSMSKIASVSVVHERDRDRISDSLPEFFRMHVSRFLATGRVSNLVRRERRAFLQELTTLLSKNEWVVNSRLTLGSDSVAFNFGFCFSGSWFWYQPTILNRALKYSPGLCLLNKIVAAACETPGVDVVDLGLGAEEYKDRFSNFSRETLHITLRTSAVSHLKEVIRHRSAETASRSPRIDGLLRRQRERFLSIRNKGLPRVAKAAGRAFLRQLFCEDEVRFYRWNPSSTLDSTSFQLRALDIQDLATAAMQHCDDAETQAYLLRAAHRLQSGNAAGYILLSHDEIPVHFCWVADFDGFHMAELDHVLQPPGPNCVLIYDCWTPCSERGKRYYARAISRLAGHLATAGSTPWIFSAKLNRLSINGITSAGFELQFSLLRKRVLFQTRLTRSSAEATSRIPREAGIGQCSLHEI